MLFRIAFSAVVLLIQVLSQQFESRIEYAVTGDEQAANTWKPYADVNLPEIPVGLFSAELAEGRVMGTIVGDLDSISNSLWSEMGPKSNLLLRLVSENNSPSMTTVIPKENIDYIGRLMRVLSALEVTLLFDSENAYVTSKINIPWDTLDDLQPSKKRLGTIIVQKPVKTSRVIENEPIDILKDLEAIDPGEQPKSDAKRDSQGFLGKYWWAILGGMVLMQIMGSDSSDRQQQAAAPADQRNGQDAPAVSKKRPQSTSGSGNAA